ncbi:MULTISPECIES: hypothetical protein [Methylobacterium]|uniref:hypothetical protein n=1 Tax=Methylobacterium TaxID=407 RepID=UPI00104642F5|nr:MULTISPECIES: hypothetical protein [Methylobacterium]MDR7039553.1 hypothetical protein [Methylobacterium sp. BE186]
MITLLLTAVVAAGAANVALVAFVADRLTPSNGASAGELTAVSGGASAGTRTAVRPGNENASVAAGRRAA